MDKNIQLTTVVRHYIKPEKQKEFEEWSLNIKKIASGFEGFLGLQSIAPPEDSNEYITVFKFTSIPALQAWMNSEVRKAEIKKLHLFSEKDAYLKHVGGIDFWFEGPEKTILSTPPKWKMSILTWLAVYSGVVLLSMLYHFLLPNSPSLLITFLVTITLVPLLTWVLMPNIVKLFKRWIFKEE
ncbi:antibiotic biosynthesis monooxygenase [uncultured Aquimarina sp.]|uniref:antibiotic biosynthesis monooxygenase n=1 Tax=uncultured Aquimarina sp. TaxID=575652 RepID=UPI00260B33A1|nr:antibiotic biosynthesis monooxygenase [uncultured Aquimarina sp.]